MFKKLLVPVLSTLVVGCLGVYDKAPPITNFESERYLGTWYEIARLDHSFERGLQGVTAYYEKRDDGGIAVTNRGYNQEKDKWQEAHGRAYFIDKESIAHLKVSFFRPFYGSYVVFKLDADYQYAYIASSDNSYLWFLSRTSEISEELKQDFLTESKSRGYDTDQIIFVSHEK